MHLEAFGRALLPLPTLTHPRAPPQHPHPPRCLPPPTRIAAGVAEALKLSLFPLATLITPNIQEASKLLGGWAWAGWGGVSGWHCRLRCPSAAHRASAGPASARPSPSAHACPSPSAHARHPTCADGRPITDLDAMKAAAEELHRYGPQVLGQRGGLQAAACMPAAWLAGVW